MNPLSHNNPTKSHPLLFSPLGGFTESCWGLGRRRRKKDKGEEIFFYFIFIFFFLIDSVWLIVLWCCGKP